jgi:hypothetical protein
MAKPITPAINSKQKTALLRAGGIGVCFGLFLSLALVRLFSSPSSSTHRFKETNACLETADLRSMSSFERELGVDLQSKAFAKRKKKNGSTEV